MEIICMENRKRRYYQQVFIVFSKIKRFKHVDVHIEEYDMDNNLEIHTFFGANGNKSRIGYIWASDNIFLETVKAKIKDPVIQNTDHKFLIFNFVNNRLFSTNNNVKKYKNKKGHI
ncbi:hypothetical protein RhiirA5_445556 [Rhizophagus irregularis]|uniref:Uncharacterized protein n=1 Tax=Rhizophagus irregularis TaxID=588596 RepID=A0A2N0NCA6_9GLOM|nr:hypothetical protein RhiirA5_445556 [Rhizophagus irregularis]